MEALDNAVEWAKKNKIAAALILLIGLWILIKIVAPFALYTVSSSALSQKYPGGYGPEMAPSVSYDEAYYGSGAEYYSRKDSPVSGYWGGTDGGAYVEVKSGSIGIKTESAVSDSAAIEGLAKSLEGYIENTQKSESDYYLNIYLTARLPSESFDFFVSSLRENYEVKSFNINFYRLSTQRELDELGLIEKTISDYEKLREKANDMELSEEQVNLLFKIAEKELELRRLQKNYESSLESKEKQSEYSTITITLMETKKVQLMPENLGNRLRNKVKYALDDASNSVMELFTGTLVVFFDALLFVVKGLVVLIVAMAGYRVALVIYRRSFPAQKKR
jgi:hypothetical protein